MLTVEESGDRTVPTDAINQLNDDDDDEVNC
jgi:hypothetical protein